MKNYKRLKVINRGRFVISVLIIIMVFLISVMSAISLYRSLYWVNKNKTISSVSIKEREMEDDTDKRVRQLHDSSVEEQQFTVKDISPQKLATYEFEKEEYTVSFYDLSYASCGKKPSHPAYGVSRAGVSLRNKNWQDKYIAVDIKRIKLGSRVFIKFQDESYSWLNGIYTAIDSGSAIKGTKIDLYYGENKTKECMKLGLTKAQIIILGK